MSKSIEDRNHAEVDAELILDLEDGGQVNAWATFDADFDVIRLPVTLLISEPNHLLRGVNPTPEEMVYIGEWLVRTGKKLGG